MDGPWNQLIDFRRRPASNLSPKSEAIRPHGVYDELITPCWDSPFPPRLRARIVLEFEWQLLEVFLFLSRLRLPRTICWPGRSPCGCWQPQADRSQPGCTG